MCNVCGLAAGLCRPIRIQWFSTYFGRNRLNPTYTCQILCTSFLSAIGDHIVYV